MQRAEIPAEGLLIIQILQSGVRFIGGGHVHKGQTNAGHDLEHKTKSACRCRRHKTNCLRWPAPCDPRWNRRVCSSAIGHRSRGRFFSASEVPLLPTALSAETLSCRLLKKISEARRTKIDERRRTLRYVDAKSVDCNEAYESFSATCPASERLRQSRQLPAAHPKSSLLNLVFVFVEPARRRAGSVRAIVIIHAAVAGTHKQRGLFEPAHRTSEMRAIDREDLKFLAREPPHPTGNVRRRAIPGSSVWIAIGRQPGLIFRKILQRAEHDPRLRRYIAAKAGEDIPDHWNGQQGRGDNIERGANRKQEPATGHCRRPSSELIRVHSWP